MSLVLCLCSFCERYFGSSTRASVAGHVAYRHQLGPFEDDYASEVRTSLSGFGVPPFLAFKGSRNTTSLGCPLK